MRRVTFAINLSLDGYCDHTIFSPDEEVHHYFTDLMNDSDLLFFGRVMYELMFPYWSNVAKDQSGSESENRFAERITDIEKVMVSTTMKNAGNNTRIIHSNPVEEVKRLKQLPGKKIALDSVSLLPEFIEANLIDEFFLVVHPVIAGKGRHLLKEGSLHEKLNLKLVNMHRFTSGCVALHYVKH